MKLKATLCVAFLLAFFSTANVLALRAAVCADGEHYPGCMAHDFRTHLADTVSLARKLKGTY
jgi:hypothetical protein